MDLLQYGPMAWVYMAIFASIIWYIWGRSEDDIMF
ncbi:hypothetical protein ACVWZ1_002527 [Thermostichus sp. MS-CIW-25]